jgi:CRAL/TRIO domain
MSKDPANPSSDETMIDQLILGLSAEEQEIAAKMSYRYFVASELNNDQSGFSQALRTAMHWFIEAEGGSAAKFDNILKRVQDTMEWRKSVQMHDLRKAFDERFELDPAHRSELQDKLTRTMENGRGYSCGYDKNGIAYIVWNMHEWFVFDDPEWHYKLTFWICERALAATERKNGQVKMNFVLNYRDFTLRNLLPIRMTQRTVQYGLRFFPEFVHKVYLLDTPFIFQVVWAIVQPLLDKSTRAKITFVKGDEARHTFLAPIFDLEESAECLLAADDNPKAGRPPLDLRMYMVETPFDECFAETK